jgi:hypothetical protein
MSIAAIARQAQGMRAGEVNAKLRGCAQEKSSPSLQKTLTSCELIAGSLSRPRQEPRQRSHKSQRGPRS